MSRLIIVDQSLKGLGGHHFDYTLQIARAAASRQCEVIVATHRKFRGCSRLDHFARIHPVFRNTTYSRFSLLAGLRAMFGRPPLELGPSSPRKRSLCFTETQTDGSQASWKLLWDRQRQWYRQCRQWADQRWAGVRESAGRGRVVKAFAADCQQFFRSIGLHEGDHVFFPTISDLDLAGLLNYWMSNPESHQPTWHMQFHFDVFVGRSPDFRRQLGNVAPLRDLFEDIEDAVPSYQLNYYATTDAIAEQYQRLSRRRINELAYPVSDGFLLDSSFSRSRQGFPLVSRHAERRSSATLAPGYDTDLLGGAAVDFRIDRDAGEVTSQNFMQPNDVIQPMLDDSYQGIPIVVAGGVRDEKGQACLGDLLGEMNHQLFEPGLGYLVCQRKSATRWWKRNVFHFTEESDLTPSVWDRSICYLPHPLEPKQYQKMIRNTGIGLLAYDRESYAHRRAGIFGEYLAAGVPVLVPAGTWMADQMQERQRQYLSTIRESAAMCHRWRIEQLDWADWNVPSAGGTVSFDGRDVPAYAWSPMFPAIESSDMHASVRFDWQWPREHGTYCKVQLLFHSSDQRVLGSASAVLGRCGTEGRCETLFAIPPGTSSIRLGFSNAYDERNASIQNLRVELLRTEGPVPRGAVGLSFDQFDQIPELLSEMCRNHDHYRATAQDFSGSWYEGHDPMLTVTQLMSSAQASRSWAA